MTKYLVSIYVLFILTGGLACGQKHAAPKPGGSEVVPIPPNIAETLSPRIVRASTRDDTTPDSSFNFSSPRQDDQILAEGDRITFTNPIQLFELPESDPKSGAPPTPKPVPSTTKGPPLNTTPSNDSSQAPPFLVFSETALSSPIVDAYYEHRMVDPDLHGEGNGKRVPISYDPVTRWWFIPILDILGGKPENAEVSDNHWLILDLDLESGARVRIKVLLRLHGTPVKLTPHARTLMLNLAPADVGSSLERGLVLLDEEFPNPTPRRLTLWVRARGQVMLHTGLTSSRHLPNPHDPPTVVVWDPHHAKTALAARKFIVETQAEGRREIEFDTNGWASFALDPYDDARVSWIFSYDGLVKRCPIPPPFPRTVGWTVGYQDCHAHRGEETCHQGWDPRSMQVTESWALAGTVIEGQWERTVRVTDRFVAPESVIGNPDPSEVFEIPGSDRYIHWSMGAGADFGAPAFDCAGFF